MYRFPHGLLDGSIIFILSMRSISDFIADSSEGLLRCGRAHNEHASPVKIWCSAFLITSKLTPGSQSAAEYLRIISLNLARMSWFTCLYFLVSSPKAWTILLWNPGEFGSKSTSCLCGSSLSEFTSFSWYSRYGVRIEESKPAFSSSVCWSETLHDFELLLELEDCCLGRELAEIGWNCAYWYCTNVDQNWWKLFTGILCSLMKIRMIFCYHGTYNFDICIEWYWNVILFEWITTIVKVCFWQFSYRQFFNSICIIILVAGKKKSMWQGWGKTNISVSSANSGWLGWHFVFVLSPSFSIFAVEA